MSEQPAFTLVPLTKEHLAKLAPLSAGLLPPLFASLPEGGQPLLAAQQEGALLWAAMENGQPMGICGLFTPARPAIAFFVLPAHRGKGYGKAMAVFLLRYAREHLTYDYIRFEAPAGCETNRRIALGLGGFAGREIPRENGLYTEYWIDAPFACRRG